MASLSSLIEYGDSSSDEESVLIPPVPKKPSLLIANKDKSGKVKVYLDLPKSGNESCEVYIIIIIILNHLTYDFNMKESASAHYN